MRAMRTTLSALILAGLICSVPGAGCKSANAPRALPRRIQVWALDTLLPLAGEVPRQ
jgi:hypothetical protein